MRCPRRLTLHHHAEDTVDVRLVALAMTLEPIEYVLILIQTKVVGQFRFPQGRCYDEAPPGFRF